MGDKRKRQQVSSGNVNENSPGFFHNVALYQTSTATLILMAISKVNNRRTTTGNFASSSRSGGRALWGGGEGKTVDLS